MTIAVGDILKFVAKGTMASGNEWNWVWHQLVTLGTTETDLTVLTALRDHLDIACLGLDAAISNTIDSTEVELFVWDPVLNRFDGTAQLDWTTYDGQEASEVLPNQMAGLSKFFTAVGRRQGRKYIAGVTEIGNAANALTGLVIGLMAAWNAVLDDPLVAGAVTVAPGTFNTDLLSPLFETFALFSGVTAVDTNPSTQRRRKPNVGI